MTKILLQFADITYWRLFIDEVERVGARGSLGVDDTFLSFDR